MVQVTAVPRTDTSLFLRDGRRLAYAEWGAPNGRPIVALYGTPGSRLFCPDDDATIAAGVRLVTVDRPGYGGSDPRRGLTTLGFADDLAELGDRLELGRFPLFGWSGGGPYALATAVRHPTRISSVGVAASWGPLDEVPGVLDSMPADFQSLLWSARRDPALARSDVEARCAWFAADPERIVTGRPIPGNPDEALQSIPAVREGMLTWFREGARQGVVGYVDDWLATYSGPWGFALGDVARPVTLWWGDGDVLCSREHTEYLARSIPGATLVVYPGEGHLAPLLHWREMLAALV